MAKVKRSDACLKRLYLYTFIGHDHFFQMPTLLPRSWFIYQLASSVLECLA
jgi:hypothetical protein